MTASPVKPAPRRASAVARPLKTADLNAVVAIDASITGRARRAYLERRLQAALRAPALHAQYAVDEDGGLAGYVLGRALEGEFGRIRPAMRLEVIGVRPAAQGRGLGAALGAALEDEAKRRGLGEMRTGAHWRDHAMLRWLDAEGWMLGRNHVLDCALAGAPLGSENEAPVLVPERDRPADRHDYGAPPPNDFEALARDLAEVRSLAQADLADVMRIDRRLTGHDRGAYIAHKLDEALLDSAIRVSLIARKDGAAAGFLMASADYGDFGRAEPVAVIDTIGVDPDFAGKGVGRALISQLFINLRALGIERVETVVARAHYGLLGFLYRAGFGPSQRLAFVKRLA